MNWMQHAQTIPDLLATIPSPGALLAAAAAVPAMVPGWLWQAANQCGKISYTSSII